MEKEYKDMADLFSIITAVEHLETAWRRNFIEDEDYESECWKLINRFKATKDVVKEFVPDIRRWAHGILTLPIALKISHRRVALLIQVY